MPELTITLPYVHSNTFTPWELGIGKTCARVDFIPQSETLDLASALAADELRFCPSAHGYFSSSIVYVGLTKNSDQGIRNTECSYLFL
jgi:hypothetical protein